MNYKEKLELLSVKPKINTKLIKEVQDIDLVFDTADNSSIKEFNDFVIRFMNKYNIGAKISSRFWGVRGYKDIQQNLYDKIKMQMTKEKPVSILQLYDDLQKDVNGKKNVDYRPYAYARVARTEGKSIASVYQLEKFKEAGLKYVKHVTRGDEKVSPICAFHNNREILIDELLNDDNKRIPLHPNCRCRYVPSMRGL